MDNATLQKLLGSYQLPQQNAGFVVLGRMVEGIRSDVVIATKAVSVPYGPRRFDASRRHLLSALDASLKRLGTDYVDLWQLHAFDPWTPLEETLNALDIAVTSGRAR